MAKSSPRTGTGYWGRVLHVDLTEKRSWHENPPEEWYRLLLGGVGLGARVLWDHIPAGADPMGPDNVLGFTAGLLVDTGTLFTGRFMALGLSPITGGWGDANCGGRLAPMIKRCKIDAVFFHGVSAEPVVIVLDEEGARFEDASELWGLDTIQTEERLFAIHGKRVTAAVIGPAGEKRSLMAGIANDGGRYAARSGLGAVMGAKRIKAIVAAGRTRVGVADRETISTLTKAFQKRLDKGAFMRRVLGDRMFGLVGTIMRAGPVYSRQPGDLFRQILKKYGTPGLTALSAESGDSPIRNWSGVGYMDFPLSRSQKIGAQALARHEVKKYGCYSCPIRCGGIIRMEDGPYPVEESHKPEYETLCAFGSLALNDDLASIIKLNDLVNRGGLDSISTGAVVAFAIECYEIGILTDKDTDGLQLTWGNGEAAIRLVEKIINREGLGDILADGTRKAAERIGRGSERYAVHCGGVEPAMHDAKFDPGFAPIYHGDPTPGRHTIASYTYLELQALEKTYSRAARIPAFTTRKAKYDFSGRGESLAVDVFFKQLIDCAGVCLFGTQVGGGMPLAEWMNAATGWDRSPDEYLEVGERAQNLRQAFNIREGINNIRDHRPHPRIIGDPPLPKGAAQGITVDTDLMTRDMYRAFHWDPDTGRPDPAHLTALGMNDLAETLPEPEGRSPSTS